MGLTPRETLLRHGYLSVRLKRLYTPPMLTAIHTLNLRKLQYSDPGPSSTVGNTQRAFKADMLIFCLIQQHIAAIITQKHILVFKILFHVIERYF